MRESWKKYEEASRDILNTVGRYLDIYEVESKSTLDGIQSKTRWEIDAIAKSENGIVIIECRRKRSRKISQEEMAAFAFRVKDTGASKGIIVTPLGLQKGAWKVAECADILPVILNADCEAEKYTLRYKDVVISAIKIVATAEIAVIGEKKYFCVKCSTLFAPSEDEQMCQSCSK